MDELQALTRWGQSGYDVSLTYGITSVENTGNFSVRYRLEWICTIKLRMLGSVHIGSFKSPPTGQHPTDPIEAIRAALIAAHAKWPEIHL